MACAHRLYLGKQMLLSPVSRGIDPEVVEHVAAEVSGRREVEEVGDLHEGNGLVAQQARNVGCGVAVDPEVSPISAHALGHFRQVFRRHAELVGIPCHLAVLAIRAAFEQGDESIHQLGILR